jgi:hypothetical protein
MLLVHVAQSHSVSEDLVQIVDTRFTGCLIEGDRQFGDFSEGLNFLGVLVQDRLGALRACFQLADAGSNIPFPGVHRTPP